MFYSTIAQEGTLLHKINNQNEWSPGTDIEAGKPGQGYKLRDSKVVIFSGLKGGCGCSFIVNSVAAYLAKNKNKNILLLDLNTGKKDSRIIFNISGDLVRDLGDIECDFSEIDLAVLKKLTVNLESSLNVILPSLKFEKAAILKNEKVGYLLEILAGFFDLILIDFPSYLFINESMSLVEKIDKLVFISQADYLSVSNLGNFISNLSCESASLKFEIVINKFNLKTVVSPARIAGIVKFPIKTFIPYDRDIEYLYITKGPFPLFNYSLRTVRALCDLSEVIYEDLYV